MVVKDQTDANAQICYVDMWHNSIQTPEPSDAYQENKIESEYDEESSAFLCDQSGEHQPIRSPILQNQPKQRYGRETTTNRPQQTILALHPNHYVGPSLD